MARIAFAAALFLAAPVAAQHRLQRFHVHPAPEAAIGYTGVVRVGNVLYLSGMVGSGTTL